MTVVWLVCTGASCVVQ